MAPSPDRYTPTPSRLPLALKAAAQAETPTFADNYTPPPSRVRAAMSSTGRLDVTLSNALVNMYVKDQEQL
ncbi:hypothetical protein [Oryza sativa Japonica Group]|uniref:Uncharacterized protein n=1 Tax=Oryza sativa subsp. japonica TaxID=39947 RepID=Q5JM59_ORYSJ|nr:hypothetical protein [Oryza sativa Japonica Group]BAD87448.1 hypothetical protein [Oryza sativa Japonica Group]